MELQANVNGSQASQEAGHSAPRSPNQCCSGGSGLDGPGDNAPFLLPGLPGGRLPHGAGGLRVAPFARYCSSSVRMQAGRSACSYLSASCCQIAYVDVAGEEYPMQDPFIYARIMSILCKRQTGSLQALRVFDEMQRRGVDPDLVCFNTAINAAG